VLVISATSSSAIEPDAPHALITQEEAIVIGARQKIDRLPSAMKFGEKADRTALAGYYASHARAPLWVNSRGLTGRAKKLIGEIAKGNSWGLDLSHFDLPTHSTRTSGNPKLIDDELRTSLAVLKYARHARGGRMDPKRLSLDIDRTPPLEDPRTVLTNLIQSPDPVAYLRSLHPKHSQFERLRIAYLNALQDEARNAAGIAVRAEDQTRKSARKRRSKPASRLSKRLLYNMEMWRWMPRRLGARHISANIPEFRVRVMDGDEVVHEERMVVGKVQNKTPIFSDEMERVVFHPFWGVPNSIKVKELLPSLLRDGNILERQGLRIEYRGRDRRSAFGRLVNNRYSQVSHLSAAEPAQRSGHREVYLSE
jgi:murein L,D-transpeptidase YcbB/YkuD